MKDFFDQFLNFIRILNIFCADRIELKAPTGIVIGHYSSESVVHKMATLFFGATTHQKSKQNRAHAKA